MSSIIEALLKNCTYSEKIGVNCKHKKDDNTWCDKYKLEIDDDYCTMCKYKTKER